jgi:hypothetical protein
MGVKAWITSKTEGRMSFKLGNFRKSFQYITNSGGLTVSTLHNILPPSRSNLDQVITGGLEYKKGD